MTAILSRDVQAEPVPADTSRARFAPLHVRTHYASGAFWALAAGFAGAAALTSGVRGLRSFNASAAVACGLTASVLRLIVPRAVSTTPDDPALKTAPSQCDLDYSIVVPVYNRPQFVTKLLGVLAAQAPQWAVLGRGEIVIVNDGSIDDTLEVAEELAREMPLPTRVVSIAHGGPGAARNAGFAAARGTIGVAIDSDCIPNEGWLTGLLREIRSAPRAVAFARIRATGEFAYPIENMPDCKGFVSASFAMNREAFCALGGFYEKYGMSHEDLDFVEVAKAAGFRVVRAESQIDHPMRYETVASLWRVGWNSKYGNLFALRHGPAAAGLTRTTPYYFFGVAGNYGSSIALLVGAANVAAIAAFALTGKRFAARDLKRAGRIALGAVAAYPLALAALGLRVGAGGRRLPRYVATLASFQLSTLLGRLNGSLEYGLLLL